MKGGAKSINALNTISNHDLQINTKEITAEKSDKPKDSFRFLMSRQCTQTTEDDNLEKKNINLGSLDGLFRLKITDGNDSKNTEDENKCDSNIDNLISGIVGILEGFGLLDHTNNEVTLPEDIKEYIQTALENIEPTTHLNVTLDKGNVVSDFNARMQQVNHDKGIPNKAQELIQQLVDEYQCSFENTNNRGVENQKVEPNTIMQMLQSAINKAGGMKVTPQPKKAEEDRGIIKTDQSIESAVVQSQQGSEKPQTVEVTAKQDAEPLVPTPQDMEENIAKIVDKVSSTLLEGKQEFDVKLKPEFLGKLSIKLTMDDSGVKAHIKAADLSVKGLIADQLPTLTESLKEKGVNMTNIEVVYDNPTFNNGEGQFQRQNPQRGSGRKNMRYKIATDMDVDSITYGIMTDLPDVSVRNSSVEYSA
jgi:flagellar hook-length control protein FliK